MKAIGYHKNLPIDDVNSLQDITLDKPTASGRDVVVKVEAISVNPVDYKIRQNRKSDDTEWDVIGWDATGVVHEVGEEVTLFQPGDQVWYAGDLTRPGSYAQYQRVDERLVGHKPKSLSFGEAAALPLTTLTAWELLFDRMEVARDDSSKTLLVIGAAGGVGSILVQLAKERTQLKVIGTASREKTTQLLQELGVDQVLDHSKKLSEEFEKHNLPEADYVISLTHTDQHFEEIVKIIKPQGKFGFIDDPKSLNIMPLKRKAVSTHIELMFTRSLFETEDMIEQHHILNEAAQLVENGALKTTVGEHFGKINAANLRKAHELLESHQATGKIVLEGF